MNDYPVWWDTTVTIYNKYVNPLTKVASWFRHVVDGCFLSNTTNITITDGVQVQSNDVVCRIRQNDLYKPKREWESLPNDKMGDYFTIGKDDILIKGAVNDVLDETLKGHRGNDLISKYKEDCIVVKKCSDNTGAGRCLPHYFVTGE